MKTIVWNKRLWLLGLFIYNLVEKKSGIYNQVLDVIVSPACFSVGDIMGSLLSSCVVVVDVGVTKKFCHNFLRNHTGQLPDIWHRASVWISVSCNAVLNLQHVHFLFYCGHRQIHKIISVTFFLETTQASFLIFGTEHQYGELYRVTQF